MHERCTPQGALMARQNDAWPAADPGDARPVAESGVTQVTVGDTHAARDEAPAYTAVKARRSNSFQTDEALTHAELEHLLAAMSSVADHSSLKPWRIIE